jgi:hypothetical protein
MFILLNRTRSLLFLTFEMEGLLLVSGHNHYLIIKINSGQNTLDELWFLTTGTVSKSKSSGWPPVSDEIIEDLREMVEETPQISVACLSQQSGVQSVLCMLLNKFKILLKNLQDLFLLKNTVIYVVHSSLGRIYH